MELGLTHRTCRTFMSMKWSDHIAVTPSGDTGWNKHQSRSLNHSHLTSLKRALVRLTFDVSSGAVGSELGLLQPSVHHEMNDFCCHPWARWVMTRSTKNTETSWLRLLQPVEDHLQLTDGPPLLSSHHYTRQPPQSTHKSCKITNTDRF